MYVVKRADGKFFVKFSGKVPLFRRRKDSIYHGTTWTENIEEAKKFNLYVVAVRAAIIYQGIVLEYLPDNF